MDEKERIKRNEKIDNIGILLAQLVVVYFLFFIGQFILCYILKDELYIILSATSLIACFIWFCTYKILHEIRKQNKNNCSDEVSNEHESEMI